MYSIDENVQSESGIKVIGVGIQENNFLDKVTFGPSSEKDSSSTKALAFSFRQEGGAIFRHLEFPIDNDREKLNAETYYKKLVKEGKTPDDPMPVYVANYVKRAYKDQASRIKHIMSKFIPEAECLITGVSTFDQFSAAVISVLGDKFKNTKVRLKLIYNSKDYATFPKYPNFIEIQGDTPTALKLSPRDRVTKQVPDSSSNPAENEY